MTVLGRRPSMEAITWLAFRQLRRGAVSVTLIAAGMTALVAATYQNTVGNALDARALAALAANPAVRTLFGTPVALDHPGGFTVWRTGTPITVLVGLWALFTATRLTRGEEDAGRWNLLAAGRDPLTRLVARHLAVLVAALLVVGAAVALALVVANTSAVGAVLHGAGVALLGVFFAAVGGLAAQLFPTRSTASGAAVAVLGAGLLLRMVGDGVDALAGLRWLSPFGLLALTRPYHADNPVPLLVLAVAGAALLAAVPAVAARRDVGDGWLTIAPERAPRLRLLRSVPGFAIRRLLRPLAAWATGIGVYYLLLGLVTRSVTDLLAENTRFAELAAAAGFGGLGSVDGAAATLFTLLGIPVGAYAATRIGALATDETARRLTPLYARPVTRNQLLTTELAVTAAGALALALVAGVATWVGAVAVDASLALGAALAGAANLLPVGLLCLGAAVLALGWLPRSVVPVGVLPAAGGFLLLVLADSTGAPEWVRELSPFAHVAPVPDASPNWTGTAALLLVAALLATLGAVGYQRRDLRG